MCVLLCIFSAKNVYGVRALADRFEVPDLLKRCSDFVRDADGIAPWRKRRLGEQWRDTQLVVRKLLQRIHYSVTR